VIISLARHRARVEYSLQKLDAAGFRNIRVYEGADGFTLDVRAAAREEGWAFHPRLANGEVGCALSMFRLWRYVTAEELPYLLVFEDDALPRPDLAALGRRYYEQTPLDLDFLFLGSERLPDTAWTPGELVVTAPVRSNHAYVVSLEGAWRMLGWLSLNQSLLRRALDCVDVELELAMRADSLRWACWNGMELPRAFPTSDEVDTSTSAECDVAVSGRDFGLVYQNATFGSTIWQPERVWPGTGGRP